MKINLTQYRLIRAQGEDAEKFLQGQLTADVIELAVGESTLTAHCDPKGKMSSIFRLFRVTESEFYLIIRQELLTSALDQLKKYAVFSKVTFEFVDCELVGVLDEECQISAEFSLTIAENRRILINPNEKIQADAQAESWDLADIQQGYPILGAKAQNEFIPQALNLQCIERAISFSKGCYIGQETVARAKYRGANKRAMQTFYLKSTALSETVLPEIGGELEMQLESGWRRTGTILSAVNFAGVLWLQAIVSNQTDAETLYRLPEGEILTLYPLPYSLAE
ncbi:hypothetical protein [Caviibacterium pharyngocola]|uniref:tRNA-modifying protein YgfZ-like beta-barrel domain-containing protein n=1 Tax=Caviibacterium pharyngocola TaxID=28159 RepID=A0A2M8RYI6_9PAST|nr:hypothetical protein [Caviibacterium pharyngocola]PJG83946.1 hypothetical protein CVP04_02305 [Caviibacterium pharyngocola]